MPHLIRPIGDKERVAEILLVEDDVDFRDAISYTLKKRGYKIRVAGDGANALLEIAGSIPDLILLDLHIPGKDGFEICQEIRKRFPASFLPIIILSGDILDHKSLALSIEAGAYDFIAKPVNMDELYARIRSLLQIKSLYETVELQRLKLNALTKVQESTISEQASQMKTLKRFFSPQIAELLVVSKNNEVMSHHRREITVCFVDLRGFTAFAESAEMNKVVELLSEYYQIVCGLALQYGGTISSLAGDGIMIFFNDPVPLEMHTEACVNFALAVRESLKSRRSSWKEFGYDVGFGIGIARGDSVIGAVGFAQFMHYTAISSTVNLAARLCKEASSEQILTTLRCLREVEGRLQLEKRGELSLKGIANTIVAYDVIQWIHHQNPGTLPAGVSDKE